MATIIEFVEWCKAHNLKAGRVESLDAYIKRAK